MRVPYGTYIGKTFVGKVIELEPNSQFEMCIFNGTTKIVGQGEVQMTDCLIDGQIPTIDDCTS